MLLSLLDDDESSTNQRWIDVSSVRRQNRSMCRIDLFLLINAQISQKNFFFWLIYASANTQSSHKRKLFLLLTNLCVNQHTNRLKKIDLCGAQICLVFMPTNHQLTFNWLTISHCSRERGAPIWRLSTLITEGTTTRENYKL